LNRKIYLLDGSGYIYRAYHGIRELSTSGGLRTNAIYGFTTLLLKLLREERPEHLAVIFDPPRGETFRSRLYPEYKANRAAMPDDLAAQVPYIKQVVRALNIPALEVPGFEADDVIATVARRYAAEGMEVTVVTSDKDLMQIVGAGISLLDTMKEKCSGPLEVQQRFGVPPERVADILGLAGDASDNIPGVPGIGEKTAAELVQRFGTIEEFSSGGTWSTAASDGRRCGPMPTRRGCRRCWPPSGTMSPWRYPLMTWPREYRTIRNCSPSCGSWSSEVWPCSSRRRNPESSRSTATGRGTSTRAPAATGRSFATAPWRRSCLALRRAAPASAWS
jgi:hypothetical protein